MKIDVAFTKNSMAITAGGEDLVIRIPPDFYAKKKGTESYNMFLNTEVNGKVRSFLVKKRNKLSFLQKLGYVLFRNEITVYKSADVTVREELIHAYATLSFDARKVEVKINH